MENVFDLFVLGRLFNSGQKGRGVAGQRNRIKHRFGITPVTDEALKQTVRVGPGGYGSPVVELALRTLLGMAANKFSVNGLAEQLALAVVNRKRLVQNMRALADAVEQYEPVKEGEPS